MSRGFGSTFGAGTSDAIQIRYATPPAAARSYSMWFYSNGTGGGGLGRAFANGSEYYQNASGQYMRTFSVGNGQWQLTSLPPTGGWHHVAITYDCSSTANNPLIYIDGVSMPVTRQLTPSGTAVQTTSSYDIGNNTIAAGTRNCDGMLAHFAIWNGILLGPSQVLALANGLSPMLMRPDSLVSYTPLDGVNNPEPDLILGNTVTITGTRHGTSDPPASVNFYNIVDSVLSTAGVVITAAMAAFQGRDYASISISEVVTTAIAAFQNRDYANISCSEIMAATIAAVQNPDFGSISIAEIIAASVAAVQQMDYGALSLDEAVAIALHGWQRGDFAAISATEVVPAVMTALQRTDYANISQAIIINAIVRAQQDADYMSTLIPIIYANAALSDSAVNNANLSDLSVYTAALTDAL